VILGIDGASTSLSVALVAPDGTLVAEDAWSSPHRQSAELLPRILAMTAEGGRELRELTAVAVGGGPGSFTGLRVAMALGKGLALGFGLPLVGVPSLAAWLASDPEAIAAVGRAGAREAYLLARGEGDTRIVDRDALPDAVRERPVVAPSDLAEAFGLAAARPPRAAATIARTALERLREDPSGDDVARIEPIYLRAPRGVETESEARVRWL
jgi:tRNA threonylcarbamoyladenosine biosynthesis protein TsaB